MNIQNDSDLPSRFLRAARAINRSIDVSHLHTGVALFDATLDMVAATEGIRNAMFLLQSIDPWHYGSKFEPVGAPNETGEPCLPIMDVMVKEITMPAGFTANPWHWQIQICESAYLTQYILTSARDQNTLSVNLAAATKDYGGIRFLAVQGTTNIQWTSSFTDLGAIYLPVERWSASKVKINAIVVKVSDTTPELNKGGMTHAADHNQADFQEFSDYTVMQLGSTTVRGAVSLQQCNSYPQNVGNIDNLRSYCNHRTPAGVLSCAIIDHSIGPAPLDYGHRIFEGTLPAGEPNVGAAWIPLFKASTIAGMLAPNFRNHNSGIIPKQLYFMNNQPQASFTVTVKMFSEYYYSTNMVVQEPMVPLMRPATPWSPKTIKILSELQRAMPAMGRESDNDFGTWLKGVVGKALPVIADILGVIPHPIAQALAVGTRLVEHTGAFKVKEKKAKAPRTGPPVREYNGKGVKFGPMTAAENKAFSGAHYHEAYDGRMDMLAQQKHRRKEQKAINKQVRHSILLAQAAEQAARNKRKAPPGPPHKKGRPG